MHCSLLQEIILISACKFFNTQVLNQEMKELQKLSAHLRQKLMESMYRHEYFREAEDLEKWITEQMQTATSEDFGQDYEHLLVIFFWQASADDDASLLVSLQKS